MKIIENIEEYRIDFEKIPIGEVFMFNNDFFMRIEIENAKTDKANDNIRANAVDLSLGVCCEFSKYCKVKKVNATMYVVR